MIVIVRERILRCRRTDVLDVGESTLDVNETTTIPFFAPKHIQAHWHLYFFFFFFFDSQVSTCLNTFFSDIILDKAID